MISPRGAVGGESAQLRRALYEKAPVPIDSPQDALVMRAVSSMAEGMGLTQRHLELLTRLARGLSRAEVADEMGVTVAAVDYHGRVIRELCGLGPRNLVLRLLRDAIVAYGSSAASADAVVRTEAATFLCSRTARSK